MLKTLLLSSLLLGLPAHAATQTTGCVSNALAGGTVDAITIPLQPCALQTNLLILTLAGANTISQPTIQMAGYPVQNIYDSEGNAPGVGALPGAGAVVLLTSTGSAWKIVSGNASEIFSGTLTVPNGGTGVTTIPTDRLVLGQGTGAISAVAAGTTGQHLVGNTGTGPSWATTSSSLVQSFSAGTTGFTPSSATTGAITLAGTLIPANGGTGLSSYTTGDLIYASSSATLAKLAGVATGNALISGGVGTAPSWGKIGLTTHVSGTLAVGNGGTGATTFTANRLLAGNGSSAVQELGAGTDGQLLVGVTGGLPVWTSTPTSGVTSISFDSTGLTPSTATGGVVTVAGTLVVANGGTGTTTATGTAGSVVLSNTPTLTTPVISGGTVTYDNGGVTGTLAWVPSGSNKTITLPNGTTDFSATGGTNQFVKQNSAGGAFTVSTIACGDLSNSGTACTAATGTSGTTLPFLDGTNTWSGTQTFGSGVLVATSPSFTTPVLGAATASSLAIAGCTIGTDELCVTGQTTLDGLLTVSTGGAAITGNTSISSGTFTASGGAFTASPASANVVLSPTGTGVVTISPATAGSMDNVVIGGSTPLAGTFTTLADSLGSVRSVPKSGSDKTGSYVLQTSDNGQFVVVGTGGSITIPDATFSTGNIVTIFNNTTGNITITCSITTAYIAGVDSDKATMTLATRGTATLLFISGTVVVVSGNVS